MLIMRKNSFSFKIALSYLWGKLTLINKYTVYKNKKDSFLLCHTRISKLLHTKKFNHKQFFCYKKKREINKFFYTFILWKCFTLMMMMKYGGVCIPLSWIMYYWLGPMIIEILDVRPLPWFAWNKKKLGECQSYRSGSSKSKTPYSNACTNCAYSTRVYS